MEAIQDFVQLRNDANLWSTSWKPMSKPSSGYSLGTIPKVTITSLTHRGQVHRNYSLKSSNKVYWTVSQSLFLSANIPVSVALSD
jgi:hypothetical protein